MGNHLSSFQSLAETNYDPEIDFRHSEHDPSEMIKLTYYPINCEGQFVDDHEKIFDFAKSSFFFTEVFNHTEFMRCAQNFKRDLLPKNSSGKVHETGILSERFTMRRKMYRPSPIDWSKLRHFPIIPSLPPTDHYVKIIEESEEQDYQRNSLEVWQYLVRLRKQFIFGFLWKKCLLDGQLMGLYRSPISSFQDGFLAQFLPPGFDQSANWMSDFKYLEEFLPDLPEFSEKLIRNSYGQFFRFYMFVKLSISSFRNKLRLDDEGHWYSEGMLPSLIANQKTYCSLLTLLIGLLKNANEKLWNRLIESERDLAFLLNESTKK